MTAMEVGASEGMGLVSKFTLSGHRLVDRNMYQKEYM